jgi:hypothetical protein
LWVLNYVFGETVGSISKIEVRMEVSYFSETSRLQGTTSEQFYKVKCGEIRCARRKKEKRLPGG